MATLDTIEILIQANIEQFQKQMNVVQNQLGQLSNASGVAGKSMGGFTGGVFKGTLATQVLIGAITKLGRGLFDVGKNIMMNGTQLTRMRIATNTLGRNIGISTSELDNMRKSLGEANTYGIKAEQVISSLARTGLFEMAQGLETVDARTGETVKGINALVLTMKDLGASAGVDSSEGIARLTDFINRGITSEVDGMVAIGNLGTEYRMYAKTLGKGREDLTATEEAQARMNLVMREGKKALGSYSDAYTTAGKMLGSMRDAMGSIFEEIGSALEPLWASLTGSILNFVQSVRNWLLDNIETIRAWATKVAGWVVYVARAIGSVLSSIPVAGKYFEGLAKFQVKSAKAGDSATKSLKGESKAMDSATGSAKDLNKELAGLQSFDEMNVLKEKEAGGGGAGGGALAGSDEMAGGGLLAGIDTAIETFAGNVKTKLAPIIEKIKEFFAPIVELWNKWVKPSFDGLLAQIKMLGDTISKSPIMPILKLVGQIIGIVIVGAIAILINALTGLFAWFEVRVIVFSVWFDNTVESLAQIIIKVREWADKWGDAIEGIKQYFVGIWQFLTGIFTGNLKKTTEGWNNIIGGVAKFWTNIWNNIKIAIVSVINDVKSRVTLWITGLKNIFNGIIKFFTGVFAGDWKKAWSGLIQVFAGIVQQMIAIFKTPMNVIISGINTFIRSLNKIKIPDWVAGMGGKGFNIPLIPKLATGGVIESPTLAMVGEAGREVVMPLDRNTGWIEELASKINSQGGNMNLTVKIGEDKIYENVIDYINDKAFRTQSNFLKI